MNHYSLLFKHIKEYRFEVLRWAFQYVKYLVRHIWFVCLGCWKFGLLWAGVTHDLSKWLPCEFIPYMLYFYGPKFPTGAITYRGEERVEVTEPSAEVKLAFDYAWLHHQKANPHHWQYWLLSPDMPRPRFTLGSHGEPAIYGVSLFEDAKGVGSKGEVFYKSPETVQKETQEDVAREYRLEDALNNTPVPLDMPMRYRKEMLADWRGAGRALGKPNTARWYVENRRRIFLHPNTRLWIEQQLGVYLATDYQPRI